MNTPNRAQIETFLRANTRLVAWAIMLVLLVDVLVAIRGGFTTDSPKQSNRGAPNETSSGTPGVDPTVTDVPSVIPTVTGPGGVLPTTGKTLEGKPGTTIPGFGTIPFGVTKDTIYVTYYWKGDRTMSSEYLGPTGQKGAVDEADAFRNFVAYVNKHADGGATFMGFPFDLHGRKLSYCTSGSRCMETSQHENERIHDTGQDPSLYPSTSELIINDPPFVAISSHGGVSDWMCDDLYKAKIFNLATYDLGRYPGGMYRGTNGYCLPQGLAFEGQVDLSVSWLANQNRTTKYSRAGIQEKRVYGILYAAYPGLDKSVDRLEARLKAAGLNIPKDAVYEMPVSLTDAAAGPATAAVGRMRGAGVNTIISPDGGAPITFTHAAQARGYTPDYYVWPCSGQDAVGQVRLFDPAQWARAEGLSCYDENWNLDLTLDANARDSEWFHHYQESAGRKDPPSSSPLVYQGMLPLLVGVTNAGRELTVERFRAGLAAFQYPKGLTRYHAINGPTSDRSHFWVSLNLPDGSQIGDVAHVRWNATKRTQGNPSTGNYDYYTSEPRYKPGHVF